jgi:hypothetical protein
MLSSSNLAPYESMITFEHFLDGALT